MLVGSVFQIYPFDFKPSAPPAGSVLLYLKTDNIIYVQDDAGNEYPFASADLITELTGDVTAVGPGVATATVVQVGGKLASEIATSVTDTQNATALNIINRIVKRDGSGNIFVTQINGVTVEAHASRHLPAGADPITTAAPLVNVDASTTNDVGTANSLARSDHQHAVNTGAASTQTPDQANAAGSSANLARADHVHNIPTDVAVGLDADSTNTQGSATKFARADHTHDLATGAPSTQNPDQANAEGSSPNLARADHIHNIPADAPTTPLSPATTNAEGTGSSFSRNDHTHAVATGLTADISTIQPDDAAAAGTVDKFARADHKHAIVAAAPIQANADGTNTEGASTSFARADHKHDILTATPVTQTPDQANAPGSASGLARADHVHNIPAAVPVQVGVANLKGGAASFALSDHVHDHGLQSQPNLHAVATPSANGFMSSTDKAKTDAELPAALGAANTVLGVNNAGTAGEYKALNGTTNQINIVDSAGAKTFSTPQDIHTGATPTFAGENLTDRLEMTEQVAPATPAANKIRAYAEDSNGFTRIRTKDDTGLEATVLRDTIFQAKNTSGSTITKGQVVYVNGSDSALGVVSITLAKADSSTTVPAIGLAMESITNNSVGRVLSIGILTNIDTSAFSDGQRVYLSATTAGALTATKPASPNIWQRVGVIIKAHATTGSIELRPLGTHGEESGTNTGFALNSGTLVDGATITIDASQGNDFSVTLGGNRTLTIINPVRNGQKVLLEVIQDGTGGRTLSLDSNFVFGLDILGYTASTAAGKTDLLGFRYSSASGKWQVVALSKGF